MAGTEGRRRRPRSAAGFTLLELTVSLAVLMLLSGLAAASFTPWLDFQQKLDTDARLDTLQAAFADLLARSALQVMADPGRAVLPVGPQTLADGQVLTDPGLRTNLAQALHQPLNLLEDGYHQSWVLRVSLGQTREEQGTPVRYRVLALLSPGANGHLEAGTRFDPALGTLVLAGDDRGVLIDGLPAARTAFLQVQDRVDRLAQALQSWFQLRWQGDADRDVSIDYFAGPCAGDALAPAWDSSADALPNGCGGVLDAGLLAPLLALQATDVADGLGGHLQVDNASAAVRNPDNPDAALRVPPYSVLVSAALPGGGQLRRSVLGTF